MLVHVVKKSGVRFEFGFPDTTPDAAILRDLAANRAMFGRAARGKRFNERLRIHEEYDDAAAPFVYDDPATVVAVVRPDGPGVVEVRRLRGPAPTEETV